MINRISQFFLVCSLLVAVVLTHAQQPPIVPVSTATATRAAIKEEIPLTGSVTARKLSRISSRVDGLIESMLVDEGDEVNAGEPLLMLDSVLAEIDHSRINAQVSEARARLKEAKRQRDEAAGLVNKKHIAATSYEAALAEVEIQAAVLQQLERQLKRQQEVLNRHSVLAPFSGVITEKLVEKGEWVATDTALFELTEIGLLRIDVPVPQYYFNQIDVGTPVRIKFDAYPDRQFSATVKIKIPTSHSSTRTFPIMIEIQNRDRLITPGMSARVFVQLGDANASQSTLIPRDAIVKKPDGTEFVWRIDAKGDELRAVQVDVQTGKPYLQNIEVIAGKIQAGDQIVIRGNEILQPGQLVKIRETLELKL